jgi:hypothetical protein
VLPRYASGRGSVRAGKRYSGQVRWSRLPAASPLDANELASHRPGCSPPSCIRPTPHHHHVDPTAGNIQGRPVRAYCMCSPHHAPNVTQADRYSARATPSRRSSHCGHLALSTSTRAKMVGRAPSSAFYYTYNSQSSCTSVGDPATGRSSSPSSTSS